MWSISYNHSKCFINNFFEKKIINKLWKNISFYSLSFVLIAKLIQHFPIVKIKTTW